MDHATGVLLYVLGQLETLQHPQRLAIVGAVLLVGTGVVQNFTGSTAATTLEVAIYQSLRFDFEPARAVADELMRTLAGMGHRGLRLDMAVHGTCADCADPANGAATEPPR